MIINIPFPGFYESFYSDYLDCEETDSLDFYYEKNGISDEIKEELADLMYKFCDRKAMELVVINEYVEAFNSYMYDKIDINLGLTFSDMSSPKEYNFETDRIFCHISEEKANLLCSYVGEERLAKTIKARFTGYDGFISLYSNRIEDWLDKPLVEWDYNELGTLLYALWDSDDDWTLYLQLESDETRYRAFNESFDWPKFKQKVDELKLIEAGECEDDGRKFPISISNPAAYVAAYESMNNLKRG